MAAKRKKKRVARAGGAKRRDARRVTSVAKKSAKKSTKKPSAPAPRAGIVAVRETTDVRTDVLAVVAQVSGKDESEVGGNALAKLTFPCNAIFTDRIAFQLNSKWSDLNPRFGPADVSCSDTVDSLTREVETRLG